MPPHFSCTAERAQVKKYFYTSDNFNFSNFDFSSFEAKTSNVTENWRTCGMILTILRIFSSVNDSVMSVSYSLAVS